MRTKISWAAAIGVAAGTFLAAGCQTAPEERPTASAGSTDSGRSAASASDVDRSERAGAMGAATTEQQSRTTEDGATAARQSGSTQRETASSATTATPYEITGRVESVDESNIEVAGRTFKVDSSTSVRKGGVGATLEDIEEGDEVRASLSGSEDDAKAVRIDVMSSKSDAPAPGDTSADR